ncbi:hypothetical protein Q5P01_024981, partial [Channa striata]
MDEVWVLCSPFPPWETPRSQTWDWCSLTPLRNQDLEQVQDRSRRPPWKQDEEQSTLT